MYICYISQQFHQVKGSERYFNTYGVSGGGKRDEASFDKNDIRIECDIRAIKDLPL